VPFKVEPKKELCCTPPPCLPVNVSWLKSHPLLSLPHPSNDWGMSLWSVALSFTGNSFCLGTRELRRELFLVPEIYVGSYVEGRNCPPKMTSLPLTTTNNTFGSAINTNKKAQSTALARLGLSCGATA